MRLFSENRLHKTEGKMSTMPRKRVRCISFLHLHETMTARRAEGTAPWVFLLVDAVTPHQPLTGLESVGRARQRFGLFLSRFFKLSLSGCGGLIYRRSPLSKRMFQERNSSVHPRGTDGSVASGRGWSLHLRKHNLLRSVYPYFTQVTLAFMTGSTPQSAEAVNVCQY